MWIRGVGGGEERRGRDVCVCGGAGGMREGRMLREKNKEEEKFYAFSNSQFL